MSPKSRKRTAKEKAIRSLVDGLSTKIYDKSGKIVFNGKDHADTIIKRVDSLGR